MLGAYRIDMVRVRETPAAWLSMAEPARQKKPQAKACGSPPYEVLTNAQLLSFSIMQTGSGLHSM
jgi:hypothetical protein